MANIIDIGNYKTLYELACASLYTDHILVHACSYYCYVCTNTMHLLFSFCTPSCYATFISEWEMGPINFSEFPPPLTLYILNCIMNCGLCYAMYIFHLVLCYDMICFFVVSINIYLTWLWVSAPFDTIYIELYHELWFMLCYVYFPFSIMLWYDMFLCGVNKHLFDLTLTYVGAHKLICFLQPVLSFESMKYIFCYLILSC